MSLQHPFAGLGVGTTDGGGGLEWLLVGWLLVAVAALGGGFGCSVIGSLEPGLFHVGTIRAAGPIRASGLSVVFSNVELQESGLQMKSPAYGGVG
jgi:hypothetical protein